MKSRSGKYLALPLREQGVFWQALLMLGWYRLAGLRLSFNRLTRHLERHTTAPPVQPLGPAQQQQAARLGWLVGAAASAAPWYCSCLAQVLVLQRMLARRGIPGQFHLGGATPGTVADKFAAHAWLRCGEAILSGEAGHGQYSVLATYTWRGKCGGGPASGNTAGFLSR